MKDISELPTDLETYLHRCCDETGYGTFQIKSEKSGQTIHISLVAAPSHRYEGKATLLLGLLRNEEHFPENARIPRSLSDVGDRIIRRLVEIWNEARGNGSVEVSCRRQKNGKTRIRIRHSFDDEVVLRPEELQVTAERIAAPAK